MQSATKTANQQPQSKHWSFWKGWDQPQEHRHLFSHALKSDVFGFFSSGFTFCLLENCSKYFFCPSPTNEWLNWIDVVTVETVSAQGPCEKTIMPLLCHKSSAFAFVASFYMFLNFIICDIEYKRIMFLSIPQWRNCTVPVAYCNLNFGICCFFIPPQCFFFFF